MLVKPPTRGYVTWVLDSGRWAAFKPRSGDVVVVTYPKCGTTWTQRIVSLLIFQTTEARSLNDISPWYEMRFPADVEELNAVLEKQEHRRAVKSHLPFDGLPVHEELRYIHVARDGRDACISLHNHSSGYREETLEQFSAVGMADPRVGVPYPPIPQDPADFFHLWLTRSRVQGEPDGYQGLSYFAYQKSWWNAKNLPNVLMVHYADLKRDLVGEMRRIAGFLDISVPDSIMPSLVEAAGFETMRKQGDELMPKVTKMFADGRERFFNKAQNGRWQGVFRPEDLALYEKKVAQAFTADCAAWLAGGKHAAGDPRGLA